MPNKSVSHSTSAVILAFSADMPSCSQQAAQNEAGAPAAHQLHHRGNKIKPYAKYSKHQNGYLLVAKGSVLTDSETVDITEKLR